MNKTNFPIRISTGKEREADGVTVEVLVEDPKNQLRDLRCVIPDEELPKGIKRLFLFKHRGFDKNDPSENAIILNKKLSAQEQLLAQDGVEVIAEIIKPT